MKTRLLIIAGISMAVITAISLGANLVLESANHLEANLSQSSLAWDAIPDPVCFAMDEVSLVATSCAHGNCACYSLSDFEALGCTKPMLDYIYRYTNLFDEEFDRNYYRNLAGLPDGIAEEDYEKCADSIFEKRKFMIEHKEFESFSIVQGTKIELEGLIMDMRLGSAHQYSLFTNVPRYTFNTGSNGINLLGIHNENDLNGKIVKLSGARTQRDLGIYVENYKIIDSLIPPSENLTVFNAKDVLDTSLNELYENPDQYYNRFVRVAGELSEHEIDILDAGVGCNTARYTTSDDFAPDGPSSRHLQDGDKIIGVRIGTHADLGKVKQPLPDELKTSKVTVMGVFVPNVVEQGGCEHMIHKSGYILTKLDDIEVVKQ